MFTIKVYDQDSTDYTSYSAQKYRREFIANTPYGSAVRLILNPGEDNSRSIENFSTAYIENAAGKTVDVIKTHSEPVIPER